MGILKTSLVDLTKLVKKVKKSQKLFKLTHTYKLPERKRSAGKLDGTFWQRKYKNAETNLNLNFETCFSWIVKGIFSKFMQSPEENKEETIERKHYKSLVI